MINEFQGKYRFLSNFWLAPVQYDGLTYTNNEAAFQAAKTLNPIERAEFTTLGPSEAKKKGRKVTLRGDWEDVKTGIMRQICLDKFTRNQNLREALLSTGNEHLEEGNTWGDRIWGTVNGYGENRLGKILMEVRDVLRNSI